MPSGTSGLKGGVGFSVFCFVILTFIGVTAIITVPKFKKASIANARIDRFENAFGILLPLSPKTGAAPLSEEQKRILRPLVQKRVAELCAREETDPVDRAEVQRRLTDTVRGSTACSRAREVAEQEGIVILR